MNDTGWHKSSLSTANGQCVEVRAGRGGVAVRDSKNPDGPVLSFTRPMWEAFLAEVKTGGTLIPVV